MCRRRHAFRSLAGNRALLRVVGGYALFILTEYSVWIAMLVYAYGRGGATIAGLVALAQLVPAAVLAPVAAALADRRSPVVLLAGGYLVQAAAMAATAAAITAGVPLAAYAAAVVAATAVTTTRPAQSTLIPSVAATPDQLTAANVVVGWVEAAGIAASGLLAGVLIALAGVASVFAVCAGLGVVAALLVAGLRVPALAVAAGARAAGAGRARREPGPGGPAAAAAADAGAADRGGGRGRRAGPAVRHPGHQRAGPPAGVGRLPELRLRRGRGAGRHGERGTGGPPPGCADPGARRWCSAARWPRWRSAWAWPGRWPCWPWSAPAMPCWTSPAGPCLQRSVPARLIGRVFGLLEGLTMAGLALGALLVPLLVYLGGSRLALLGVAAVLPLAAAIGGRALFGLDAGAPVPVVEIALLRSLPLFAELPAPAIEGLAAALTPVRAAGRRRADPAG